MTTTIKLVSMSFHIVTIFWYVSEKMEDLLS
jgi:hypothetical protein